jgi:hypothetical protein
MAGPRIDDSRTNDAPPADTGLNAASNPTQSPNGNGAGPRDAAPPPQPETTPPPQPSVASPPPPKPEIVDVWSRTEPKYRIRAVALLFFNILLFCGLCIFAHWLHFGRAFDFSPQSYIAPSRFWDPAAPNLNDFILSPINVVDVPLHAIVLGLVVAVTVAMPIVVSILYRFPAALPFILAVLVFAHMPWMAATLLGSCVLASVRPFRMKFRFGSALVGLLPVLVYLYLSTRGTPDQLANYGAPTQRSLLIAPWLIAMLGAALMLGIVLLISRIVNYRPGAVSPVLAVMFALPVGLFHVQIGSDELAYRVLEAQYGPRSERFQPKKETRETENAIYDLIAGEINKSLSGNIRSNLRALWSLEPERLAELKRTVSRRMLADFLADRMEAYEACKRFIADHPHSRYVPNVLYMQARILDTRLDEAKLANETPVRELYSDFPHVQSEEIWTTLLRRFPDTPFAFQAGLSVAELRLRAGDVDGAANQLENVLSLSIKPKSAPPATQPGLRSLLSRAEPEGRLDFQPEPYRQEAARLLELIRENRGDPTHGDAPLIELAALDPRRAGYLAELRRLAEKYPDSRLYENLIVRWAAGLADANEREAALEGCLRTFTRADVVAETLWRLANLDLQVFGTTDAARREKGMERIRRIVEEFPETCWAKRATERLNVMKPARVENGSTP